MGIILTAVAAGLLTTANSCDFNRDLFFGVRGDDVKCLQEYLGVINTGFFGNLTRSAVSRWQTDNGVAPTAGYFGSISRKKYQQLASAVTVPTEISVPTTVPSTATPEPTPVQPAPAQPTAIIKTGSGTVANNSLIDIGAGKILYNGSGLDNRGYLYPQDSEILVGNLSVDDDYSTCENIKAYKYQGVNNVCQFTNPVQLTFRALSSNGVRFYDKIASKSRYSCNYGVMIFKQNGLYGALDFDKVDSENNLQYHYWLDTSGGTNFGSLCPSQANVAKLNSLLANLKSVLEKLKEVTKPRF